MDVDAYEAAHRPEWDRLEALLRTRRPDAARADELVELYRRATTHLSVLRSAAPDPVVVGRLTALVGRARTAIVGTPRASWATPVRFVAVTFPAALAASWRWWVTTAVVTTLLGVLGGAWVAGDPEVQAAVAPPEEVRRLIDQDFAGYYRAHPATAFAAQVWTNNAWLAAVCLVTGVLLVPVLLVLAENAANIAVSGGLLAAHGRSGLFFGLILPHGMLELTALFVAAGAGLRLGWSWIDPGPLRRAEALAREGRTTAGMALGVTGLLLISGLIEAFVTPSGLPTWARVGVGALAEAGFVAYVLLGVRRLRQGASGDVATDLASAPAGSGP